MKTTELTGAALDWAVAKCEDYTDKIRINKSKEWEDLGRTQVRDADYTIWSPSEDWAQGGPIIEREKIGLLPSGNAYYECGGCTYYSYGDKPLIASMRCYVASKLGDNVEIPKELTQ